MILILSHSQGAVLTKHATKKIRLAAARKMVSVDNVNFSARFQRNGTAWTRLALPGDPKVGAGRVFHSFQPTIAINSIVRGRNRPKLTNQKEKNGIANSSTFWVHPGCHCKTDLAWKLSVMSQTKNVAGANAAATRPINGRRASGRPTTKMMRTKFRAKNVWIWKRGMVAYRMYSTQFGRMSLFGPTSEPYLLRQFQSKISPAGMA